MEEILKRKSLGKYELIASVGQGGMASVYLAVVAGPAGFSKLMVLKLLREEVLKGMEEGVNMFLDEARLSARLVHPNIVHTYEVGENDGQYFIAMEYLDGQSYRGIQQRSRKSGGIPVHEELRIISETARGLHYSHTLKGYAGEPLNVVHRDVSPQNVFITYDGQVKLLDFGIAKASDAEHLTKVGVIKGKLDYIAPEQLRGEPLDGRADIFALGAMLWEAVTGKRFSGGRKVPDVNKVHARIAGGEPNVRTVQPEIPEVLARIIDRAIALKPSDRFSDAAQFADELDAYLESTGQKPSAKTLSAFVSPLFQDERDTVRKLIERQMELVKKRETFRMTEHTASLPEVRLGPESTSGHALLASGLHTTIDEMPRSLAPLYSARAKRRRRLGVMVASAVSLLGAIGFLWSYTKSRSIAAEPLASAPPQHEIAAAANAEPLGTVHPSYVAASAVVLQIDVKPANATLNLDGVTVVAPFRGSFPKDSALHHLEVTAPGHRSIKRLIGYDKDQQLEIALERLPERAPPPARRAPAKHVSHNDKQVAEKAEKVEKVEPVKPAPPAQEAKPAQAGDEFMKVKRRVVRTGIDATDPYATSP